MWERKKLALLLMQLLGRIGDMQGAENALSGRGDVCCSSVNPNSKNDISTIWALGLTG